MPQSPPGESGGTAQSVDGVGVGLLQQGESGGVEGTETIAFGSGRGSNGEASYNSHIGIGFHYSFLAKGAWCRR